MNGALPLGGKGAGDGTHLLSRPETARAAHAVTPAPWVGGQSYTASAGEEPGFGRHPALPHHTIMVCCGAAASPVSGKAQSWQLPVYLMS